MTRPAEWTGWQAGASWLPLGGTLMMQSLTSPSGRFTVLHSCYEPSLAVRDNLTRDRVWVSDAPCSSLISLGPDGDLVAWNHHGERLWSTDTAWRGVRRLEMRDSGELALTDAAGAVVWSSPIPAGSAAPGERRVAHGSVMHPGESLDGQSLTSDDGSTVLWHSGRIVRVIVRGHTSHWDRYYDQENILALEQDGHLRVRALDGTVVEEIAGPGAELVVVRGRAELRDSAGTPVWSSAGRSTWMGPVREPAIPQEDDLAAWFRSLAGDGRGYCVAVVSGSTAAEVLERAGVAVTEGTWHQLTRACRPVVAAVAVGPDVLVVSDDPDLAVTDLAPSVVAVQQRHPASGYWATFSVHRDGRLLTEMRDDPRRRKGLTVPEVAVALGEITHGLHRLELVFRLTGVVPSAARLAGQLLGGGRAPQIPVPAEPVEALPVDGYDGISALVIRTDFTDEDAWDRVVQELREPWLDDPVEPFAISDLRFAGQPPDRLLRAIRAASHGPGVFFLADEATMREPDNPLLAVTTEWDGEPFQDDDEPFVTQFRLRPDAAVEVSTNINIGNMDFKDFAGGGTDNYVMERWT